MTRNTAEGCWCRNMSDLICVVFAKAFNGSNLKSNIEKSIQEETATEDNLNNSNFVCVSLEQVDNYESSKNNEEANNNVEESNYNLMMHDI